MAIKTKKTSAATTEKATKTVKPKKTTKAAKETKATKKVAVKSKPTTKAKPKTSVATPAVVQSHSVENKTTNSSPKFRLKIRKSYVILAVVILAFAAFLYFFRSLFVAAVVNGQPVSRLSVVQETEKQAGKQALSNLVRNTLIEQEARKKNVTVSEQEIDAEVKKVEDQLSKQGQKLDQVLEMQGMSKTDLRKLIKLDKLVGKLVGQDIKITDKQATDYIEQNKETLPQDMKEDELKKMVTERLKQQQLNEKVQTWLEKLQKDAKVMYFVQY